MLLVIKFDETLGGLSFSSPYFPRKTLSCDENNSDNITKVYIYF